ncbi:MAG: HNH endonuclease [Bacteroidales bacterium]|nr:HNH endonuclease [Bacteroidales bacterium]
MRRNKWTSEEVAILKEMYSREDVFASDIAARLGCSVRRIYNKAKSLGLKRPREIQRLAGKIGTRSEAAMAHRFQKGHAPANKGKKMSPETYAKVARTMFKKGRPSINHRPVGSERVSKDGYVEIKVAEPNKWRLKHRVIWEQERGQIPPGHNIQFKDGNPLNLAIDNLYIIDRVTQLKEQNSLMARYPKEIQQVIRLRGAVKRQITMHNKKENQSSNE